MSLKYDAKADLWSIGTIIYLCLTNKAPFSASTPQALKQYYEDNPRLQPKIPIETSQELRDLLCGLLRYDAKDRMDFDEFFNHPFFKSTPKNLTLKNQKTNNCNYEIANLNQNPSSFVTQSPGTPPSNYGSPNDVIISNNENDEDDELEDDFVIVESPDDKMINSKESPNGGYYLSKLQDKENFLRAENLKQLKKMKEKTSMSNQRHRQQPQSLTMRQKQESPPEPIPVPSQKEAYEKMKRSYTLKTSDTNANDESGTIENYFDENNASNSSGSANNSGNFNSTSSNKFMADITQMSPPTVQFMCTVGTPPFKQQQMSNSRRRFSGGPIATCGSPTNGSNTQLNFLNSPGYQQQSHQPSQGNFILTNQSPPASPILANRNIRFQNSPHLISPNRSPILDPRFTHFTTNPQSDLPNSSTTITNNQLVRSSSLTGTESNFKWMLQDSGNKQQFTSTFATCFNKLALTPTSGPTTSNNTNSQHHQFGFVHNFNSHPHLHHPYHSHHLNSPHQSNNTNKNLPNFPYYCSNQFTNFFPNILNNYQFTHGSNDLNQYEMPGLQEETLLEKEHNETLAKLNFIVALVECIINLAESRANPVSVLTESTCKEVNDHVFLHQIK